MQWRFLRKSYASMGWILAAATGRDGPRGVGRSALEFFKKS
jgi:hypothetical protein